MSDPNDWNEHGFAGGILVGVLWAARELLPKMFRSSNDDDQPRRVTPTEVRDEIRLLSAKFDGLSLRMDVFQQEENRVHGRIEQEIRDALNSRGGG